MLQMVRKTILAVFAVTIFCSCNTHDFKGLLFPTGAGVEKRFEQSQEITSGKPVATVTATEEYEFYVCTDPHIDASAKNLQKFNDAGYGHAYTYGPCHGTGMIEVEAPWCETSSTYNLEPNMTFQVDTYISSDTFGVRWEKGIAVKEGGYEVLSPEIPLVCPEIHF